MIAITRTEWVKLLTEVAEPRFAYMNTAEIEDEFSVSLQWDDWNHGSGFLKLCFQSKEDETFFKLKYGMGRNYETPCYNS